MDISTRDEVVLNRRRSRACRMLGAGMAFSAIFAACSTGSTSSSGGTVVPVTSSTEGPPATSEPLPDIDLAPSATVGVVVVSTADGVIELAWEPARDGSVFEYEVSRVSPAGSTERFTVDEASFTDTGLDDGDIFTYRIVAVGAGGRAPGSEAVTARVGVDSNPPKRPDRPTFIDDGDSVTLQWTPVTDISGIDRYMITRSIGDDTVEIDNGPATTFTDDVAAGIVVTYSVRAIDGVGNESESSRAVTMLTGTSEDEVVIVVSAEADPEDDPSTARLHRELLDAGFVLTWVEDEVFDSNITSSGDVVLLLGDVQGDGFDWNVFGTDATIIGLKSMFVEAGGITENPPKLDRLAQLDYLGPDAVERQVALTSTGRPKPVVYIPVNEQLPSLQTWARPTWSTDIAVAGVIPAGGVLANEKPAPGCRAFFPGNSGSLAELTDDGWQLLIDFVGDITATCT